MVYERELSFLVIVCACCEDKNGRVKKESTSFFILESCQCSVILHCSKV